MFFVDLVTHYAAVLPPTLAKKKRESERKVPLRKRTAPVDMRMSRSRLSVGTDARDWLAAQRASGNVPPPVPPVPAPVSQISAPTPVFAGERQPEWVAQGATPSPIAEAIEAVASPAQPPAPLEPEPVPAPSPEPEPTPEPAPAPPVADDDAPPPRPSFKEPSPEPEAPPPRPSFKEPPPELDDLPPRPAAFKEPALDDASPPPRPSFAEPPPESDEKTPSAATVVVGAQPASPGYAPSPRAGSPASSARMRSPISPALVSPLSGKGSRSPSPSVNEDQPLSAGRASLARTVSGEASRLRGPRTSRPPRTPGGSGSVSNMVANLNRHSLQGGAGASPRATSPPASAGGLKGRRPPSSLVEERRRSLVGAGGKGALSRRTMESDAEDNIVN